MGSIKAVIAMACFGLAFSADAFALEHDVHGSLITQFVSSNFNRNPTTDYSATSQSDYDPSGQKKRQYSANFVEQRVRFQYDAKSDADLKLVSMFELDYAYWGNSSYSVGNGQGGAVGSDSINLETKSLYLDYRPLKDVTLKLGMMPNRDIFKGVLFDTDMAGLMVSGGSETAVFSAGYFRLNDKSGDFNRTLGLKTNDLLMLQGAFELTKALKISAAYYFFRDNTPDGTRTEVLAAVPDTVITVADVSGHPYSLTLPGTGSAAVTKPNYNDVKMHVLGFGIEYTQGPLALNCFGLYENGWNNTRYTSAFAGNVGARLKTRNGTARMEFLYVSGDSGESGRSSAFYAVEGENRYFDNEMTMLGRDRNALSTDNSILFNTSNKGQGQIGGYLGYDRPISARLTTSFNAGFAAIAKENSNKPFIYSGSMVTDQKNNSNFLGSEFNGEAAYQLRSNLTATIRIGYAILGEYYKGVALNNTPMNPYDAKIIIRYSF